jgi:hypothetical protein
VSLVKVFPRFQVVPARISTTAFVGLPLFAHLVESLGLIPALQEQLRFLKRRQRDYSVWQQCTIKTLRLRLLNIGAVVVRHARELLLKVPADHPYWQLLAHRRDKVLRLVPR